VVQVEKDTAYVLFKRSSACGKCQACGMLKDMSEITVSVENTLRAQEGDQVALQFSDGQFFKSSLMAYIFPLIMLITGVFLGYYIHSAFNMNLPADILAAILGIGLTAMAFLAIRLLEPRFRKKLTGTFSMVSVENNAEVHRDGN